MTKQKFTFFYFIAYECSENSVDTYIGIMRYIEIWIMDIYELNNFETTWKSSNIYSLPKQVFYMFLLIYFIIRFVNIKNYFETP